MQRLSQINLLSEKNETVGTSRFEASWASMMDTLEKIRNMIDDLRRLVESLNQMTQTLIAVINELSDWMDQVSTDPSVLSSV
jgi:methyl-accepting chemotaxis protein